MSIELTYLVWSATLAFMYVLVQSTAYRMDYGLLHAGSQRDGERAPNKWAARGNRALRNFLETYGLFIALAVATELSGRSNGMTQWGTQLWFWSRVAYLPAYFIDIPFARSAVWSISLVGLVMLFIGVAF